MERIFGWEQADLNFSSGCALVCLQYLGAMLVSQGSCNKVPENEVAYTIEMYCLPLRRRGAADQNVHGLDPSECGEGESVTFLSPFFLVVYTQSWVFLGS